MATVSLQQLINRVSTINDQLGALRKSLSDSYLTTTTSSNTMTKYQSELRDLKEQEAKYDSEFREEQNRVAAYGGKTRHQTLQEFVLLFFYISFAILTISLLTFSYISTQNYKKSLTLLLLMTFIGLIVTAILIRYA